MENHEEINAEENNKTKSISIYVWLSVTAIIFFMLGFFVCMFIDEEVAVWVNKPTQKEIEKPLGKLSYVNSVKDNEEMALAGAHEFEIYRNYLYVTSVRDNGVEAMDISNPAEPKHIGAFFDNKNTLMEKPHSISFKGNYAFLGSMESSAIQILDISDPKNINPISNLKSNLNGLHGTAINGDYLYVAYTSDDAIEIIDISDPRNLKKVTTVFDNEIMALSNPHEFAFSGNYCYVISGTEGLEVLDISDPENPTHVSSLIENNITALSGGHGITIEGDYAYVASYADGFAIINISDPLHPVQTSAIYPTEENGLLSAADVSISENYAFVVSEVSNALAMIEIWDPKYPRIVDIIRDNGSGDMFLWNGHFIKANGKYLYVAGLQDGFGAVKYK